MGLLNWLNRVANSSPQANRQTDRFESAPKNEPRRSTQTNQNNTTKRDARWIEPGGSTMVHGFTIPDGMVYVGKGLRAIAEWAGTAEPALIDPSLPVDTKHPDWAGAKFSYWPSYSRIPPSSRAAYLHWLAAGRRTPDVPIGYVFLYFYGLERRALRDLHSMPQRTAELDAISNEVRSLLRTYGGQGSFRFYATSFAGVVDVMRSEPHDDSDTPPILDGYSWEIPADVCVGLGRLIKNGTPLSSKWALTWFRAHPECYSRTPSQRCPDEYELLWDIRYKERYGSGLVVKPNRSKLKFDYQPASASFGGSVEVSVEDIPDIRNLKAPVNKLAELASACENELDAYSRYLGRHPDDSNSLAAVALLPDVLAAKHAGPAVGSLCHWAETQLATEDVATAKTVDLLEHWPTSESKLKKTESLSLAQVLSKRGYGIEPDVRFGGKPFATPLVTLFRLPNGAPTSPSPAYQATTVLLHLATAVAHADGTVSQVEQGHLVAHLEEVLALDPGERVRLHAHLIWLIASGAPLGGMAKRVEAFDTAQRQQIGRFLVSVAAVDGRVQASEIAALTKVFSVLGLEKNSVYETVNELSAHGGAPVEPVTVRRASPQTGYSIPKAPTPSLPVPGTALDMEKVKATLQESARVTALLGDIFLDDDNVPAVTAVGQSTHNDSDAIDGLDAVHSSFARSLGAKTEWNRSDVEQLASNCGLMLDGAVDTINECAFERCGDPLITGDESIEIDINILKELET